MLIGCWRYVDLFVLAYTVLHSVSDAFTATLHILPLISFADLKSKVRDLTIAEVSEVSWLFRVPNCEF